MSCKTYIGDGVYAKYDGFELLLYTEREGGTDRIYLEPSAWRQLVAFRARVEQGLAPDVICSAPYCVLADGHDGAHAFRAATDFAGVPLQHGVAGTNAGDARVAPLEASDCREAAGGVRLRDLAQEANNMPPDAEPGAWQDLALRFAALASGAAPQGETE